MESIQFYFDEHIRLAVVQGVRRHGIDVLTAYEAGRANQRIADADQLAFATDSGRILVSSDTHFLNFHVVPQIETGAHGGVIFLRQSVGIGDQIRYLRYIASIETQESMKGTVRYFAPVPLGMFDDD